MAATEERHMSQVTTETQLALVPSIGYNPELTRQMARSARRSKAHFSAVKLTQIAAQPDTVPVC